MPIRPFRAVTAVVFDFDGTITTGALGVGALDSSMLVDDGTRV